MIDDIFWSKASQLSMLVNDYNEGKIYYDYKDKDMDSWKTGISLGEVFTNLRKYNGKILERWKGLGSIPPDIFWDMVLNPTKRTLLRLTVTDLEKDTRDIPVMFLTGHDDKESVMSVIGLKPVNYLCLFLNIAKVWELLFLGL